MFVIQVKKSKFMITRLSIAFEDLLGSWIAPKVMLYCLAHVSIVLQLKFGEMEFKEFLLESTQQHDGTAAVRF